MSKKLVAAIKGIFAKIMKVKPFNCPFKILRQRLIYFMPLLILSTKYLNEFWCLLSCLSVRLNRTCRNKQCKRKGLKRPTNKITYWLFKNCSLCLLSQLSKEKFLYTACMLRFITSENYIRCEAVATKRMNRSLMRGNCNLLFDYY